MPVRSPTLNVSGAAERERVDLLDAVEVHLDRPDVAPQAHAAAVARELERARRRRCRGRTASRARRGPRRGRCRHRASSSSGRGAAEVDEVVALVRRHVVELVAAEQHVVAAAAEDDVAAVAAVDRQPDPARRQRRAAQLVVAGPAVEAQRVGGAGVVDLDEDRQPDHRHGAAGEREDVDEVALRRARQARLAEGAVQLVQRRELERSPTSTLPGSAGRGEVEALDPVERDRDAAVGAARPARRRRRRSPGRAARTCRSAGPGRRRRRRRRGRSARRLVVESTVPSPSRSTVSALAVSLSVDLLVGRAAGDEQPAMAELERAAAPAPRRTRGRRGGSRRG